MGIASERIDSRFDKIYPLFVKNKGAILAQKLTNTFNIRFIIAEQNGVYIICIQL